MAAPSRQTRKSLSAIPTPLPSTATASSSNIAGPGSGKAKAGKRPASFAPGDKVGFGSRPVANFGKREEAGTAGGGSNQQKKVARPAAAPRKSILKPHNKDDVTLNYTTGHIGLGRQTARVESSDDDDDDEDENETQFRRLPGESTTRMFDRKVSWAKLAHVRMFDVIMPDDPLAQSTSSVGSSHSVVPTSPASAPNYSSNTPPPPSSDGGAPPATATQRRSSTGNVAAAPSATPAEKSRRRSSAASFASEGSADMSMEEDSDEARTDEEDDGGEAMEMTQAVGGIHAAPPTAAADGPFSPSASTISAQSDDEDLAPRDDEDRTMDFTVATGGIIPPSAPPTADVNVRRSIGYGIQEEEARRLNNWFAQQAQPSISRGEAAARAAAEEMARDDEADDEEMEAINGQGGIIAAVGTPFDSSTDEVEMDLDDEGEMDYTTAAGGIFGAPPAGSGDDDETEELDQDDGGGMDFTVAGGGISYPAETAAGSNIFAPLSTSGRASLSAPSLRQTALRSPAKSPRKSIAAGPAPTPTRPISSSLSRPTASSAAKAKALNPSVSTSGARNLFESPIKISQQRSRASLAASPGGKKRPAEGNEDDASGAGGSLFAKSPAKRRASEAAPRVGGDLFGQLASAPPGDDAPAASGFTAEPSLTAAPATVSHSIFSPVKNALSSIFSPARASPKGPPAAATAGAKQSFPASLFASPIARAGSPSAVPEPVVPEVNIFSTSPQAAPPTSLSASFSGATANLFNPPPEEVEVGADINMTSAEAVADELFDEEVAQEQEATSPAAAPPTQSREETATPSKKRLGRPSLAVGGAAVPLPRASQESADAPDEDEMFQPEPVSLQQFLDMTGLSFMTNMTAGRRRSTIQPGEMLGLHRRSTEGTGRSGGEYSLFDYAHHVLNMQDYVVYHWACNNLRDHTEKSREIVQVLDEEASIANPLLFTEYLEADDDEKRMIETQLKHLKTYAQHMVHKRWLEWRLEILTPLKEGHERDRAELLEDRARLNTLSAAFDRELNLVELRAKHASLRLQLAQEKRKVEEVQACDQEELAHRRSDIKEQKDQIDNVKSELHDEGVILASLQAKKESIAAQKKTYVEAIEFGKHASAGSFTAERLPELEDEVRTIEYLHSVQLTDRSATHVELVILDELKLVLACNESMPSPAGASIERVGSTRTKRNPELAAKLFSLVQREVERNTFDSVPALVQRVHQLWLATIRLTHEIQLIRLRYPVAYTSPSPAVVRAQAIIMVCPIKAKLVASFDLTLDTLARWPTSTDAIAVAVEVKYSRADVKADAAALTKVIVDRLQKDDQRFGALVDGCLDAVGLYA